MDRRRILSMTVSGFPAAPLAAVTHYAYRGLRLPLAHVIESCMTLRDKQEFWAAYRAGDLKLFADVLRRIDAHFQARPANRLLKELLGDVFAWAIVHPGEVLDFTQSPEDAPNMIASGDSLTRFTTP
jgi:hypothetical protein